MSSEALGFLDDPRFPWTALDRAFVRTLHSIQPVDDHRHAWLAALASQQLGLGHACLEFEDADGRWPALAGWEPEAIAAVPRDLDAAVASLPWTDGEASPLVSSRSAQGGLRLYLRRAWLAEHRILARLRLLLAQPLAPPPGLEESLAELFPGIGARDGSAGQRRACEVVARGAFTIVTGGPGTGKTTAVARVLAVLLRDAARRGHSLRVALAAPTGKAAARLGQSLAASRAHLPEDVRERVPTTATTIHKLLGLRTGVTRPARPLAADVIVVDEASMVDLELMATLLEAVPDTARLVLLGDRDQLASVEAGAVLAQLCDNPSLESRVVVLRHSHRFASDSGIGEWARLVNAGDEAGVSKAYDECPAWRETVTVEAASPVVQVLRAVAGAKDAAPGWATCLRDGWRDWLGRLAPWRDGTRPCSDHEAVALLEAFARFQVLCPLRRGPWGVETLNPQIARHLGFPRGDWYPGRPVMVTRNDHALELMNGDVGLCLPRTDGLRVAFGTPGGLRWVIPSRLDAVETVFAMTVHKSQGSEFRHVLLVLPDRPSAVLTRELLYTGITRASGRLTLRVPDRATLRSAVRTRVQRSGGLAEPLP